MAARPLALLVLLGLLGPALPAAAADPTPVTALVIIDVQDFYFPGGGLPLHEPELAGANVARLLARFRADGRPVIHVRHEAAEGGGIHADVAPLANEPVITKTEVNAFRGTDLQARLGALGVTDLVLVGMQTHMCLEGAVRAAADLGYACTVVADACATRDLQWQDRTVAAADVQASTLATLRAYATITDTDTYLGR
ncbi:MAG: cysteine hydrolase family protein [Candidatus Krumholzibacteriia bacterium]